MAHVRWLIGLAVCRRRRQGSVESGSGLVAIA
jgi:hypothetical protein